MLYTVKIFLQSVVISFRFLLTELDEGLFSMCFSKIFVWNNMLCIWVSDYGIDRDLFDTYLEEYLKGKLQQ